MRLVACLVADLGNVPAKMLGMQLIHAGVQVLGRVAWATDGPSGRCGVCQECARKFDYNVGAKSRFVLLPTNKMNVVVSLHFPLTLTGRPA